MPDTVSAHPSVDDLRAADLDARERRSAARAALDEAEVAARVTWSALERARQEQVCSDPLYRAMAIAMGRSGLTDVPARATFADMADLFVSTLREQDYDVVRRDA